MQAARPGIPTLPTTLHAVCERWACQPYRVWLCAWLLWLLWLLWLCVSVHLRVRWRLWGGLQGGCVCDAVLLSGFLV
jgi:hypothetical protein